MKEILPNIFAVEVPGNAKNIELFIGEFRPWIKWHTGRAPLPKGSYTFLFCSNDVTEEQADGIVSRFTNVTAVDTFKSLLRLLKLTGNYAIIKINNYETERSY